MNSQPNTVAHIVADLDDDSDPAPGAWASRRLRLSPHDAPPVDAVRHFARTLLKTFRSLGLLAMALVAAIACDDSTGPTRARIASIVVSPRTLVLAEGGTRLLVATVKDAAGNVLAERAVAWSSDNPGTASVSGVGLVSAGEPGYATITATAEEKRFSIGVTVTAPEPQPF